MNLPSTSPLSALAAIGRRLFPLRLIAGLVVTGLALEWLRPQPFFAAEHLALHLCGVAVIAAGLALRMWGAGSAGGHTRRDEIMAPRLVTGGPFAHMRNPIYTGAILLGIGMSMVIGDPLAFAITALTFAILYFGIVPAEEEFLAEKFGAEYLRYRQAVPRLFPRLRPWAERTPMEFRWRDARGELWLGLLLIAIYGALLLEEHLDRLGYS